MCVVAKNARFRSALLIFQVGLGNRYFPSCEILRTDRIVRLGCGICAVQSRFIYLTYNIYILYVRFLLVLSKDLLTQLFIILLIFFVIFAACFAFKIYLVMENYVVINGVRYVLTQLPFNGAPHCHLCAFFKQCEEMIEYPFCEIFGFVDGMNEDFIFVKCL